ncbi:KGGVGR-motif variant AAA ATPase [Pyxidicoccus sp. 3LFB2]
MPTTHISTFYSFKGGVGRTLLLANVGVSLARGSRKVLLWDLDVEAPGLHFISGLRPDTPPARGFFEWLVDWQQAGFAPPEGALLESFLTLPYAVSEVPGLFVLPAFGARSNFARLYQEVDWPRFTAKQPEVGLQLFQKLLEGLSAQAGYEHVLLDSRTGITDLGGLLTAVLPHATVLVGNYSAQNTTGLLSVYRALQKAVDDKLPVRQQGPLHRLLVASPVPLHEDAKQLAARRDVWDKHFERPPDETRVEVPLVPQLLVSESLLVETEPDTAITRAYKRVAEQLSGLRAMLVRKQESAELDTLLDGGPFASRMSTRRGEPRVRSFEERVEQLLVLLGYTVGRAEKEDLLAERKLGFQQERYLVRCKETRSPLSAAAVVDLTDALVAKVDRMQRTVPMLVVSGLSSAAREYLKGWDGVSRTLKELERELFDFKPYLAWLRRSYEESTLARSYVDPRFIPRPQEPGSTPALERGTAWAHGRGPRLWVVLGDQGAGKSSFVRRLAYELATSAEQDEDAPVPLYIALRQQPGLMTLETLLQQHLSSTVGWRGDVTVLLHLLSLGRVVLLLDGLDELGTATAGLSALEEQLRYLARPTAQEPERSLGNRLLVTARTSLFREPRPAGAFASDEQQAPLTALGQVALTFGAKVDELAGWNQEQIFRLLTRSVGEERAGQWRTLLNRLEEKSGLMTSSPLLVEMLLHLAPELSAREGHLSLGAFFQHFADRWFAQVSAKEPGTPGLKPELLDEIARELRGRPQGRLSLFQMLSLLNTTDNRLSPAEVDRLWVELRASPFLVRAAQPGYQFASKSFEDFFFARSLLRATRAHTLRLALDTPPLTSECASFLADLVAMEGGREELESELREVLGAAYRPRVSENALWLAYEWCANLAGKPGPESQRLMSRVVPYGARLEGADLRKSRLAHAWLAGARLEDALLDGADLTGAHLREVEAPGLKLRGAMLDDADFSGAELAGADFSGSSAFERPPSFRDAMLRDVRLRATAWQLPSLRGASLRSADIGLARWIAPRQEGTDGQEVSLAPVFQEDVKCVAVSPDGTLLVISSGWSPWVWDCGAGRPLMVLAGNEAEVTWVSFSPDGAWVAGGCDDGKLCLWEVASGKLLRLFQAHARQVLDLAFSPDGRMLATASEDGTARLWDARSGEPRKTFKDQGKKVSSVAFSPDGTLLATGSEDALIVVWNIASGERVQTLRGHRETVNGLAFDPHSPLRLASGSWDGTLRIWDLTKEEEFLHFDPIEGAIASMAFNGTYLAAITEQDSLGVWNAETGKAIHSTDFSGQEGAVAFMPGSTTTLVYATSRTLSIEGLDGTSAGALRVAIPWVPATTFLPGDDVLLGCEDGTLWRWDTRAGECRLAIQTGNATLVELAVSPDGTHLVTAVSHGPVQIWSLVTGELVAGVSNVERLRYFSFSPDGHFLAGAGDYALVWDLTGPRPQVAFALEGHEGLVEGIAFSPDGRWLVTFDDEALRLWDGKTGAAVRVLPGLSGRGVHCAVFSPDGRWLAAAGEGGGVYLWDVWDSKSSEPARVLRGPEDSDAAIYGVVFSQDGSWLLTGAFDGSVCVWDGLDAEPRQRRVGRGESVRTVVLSRDGRRALTTGWTGTARLWDTESWKLLAELVKLPRGWATLAGPYAVVSPDADMDRVAVQAGNRFAPLSLLRDVCIRPDKVQDALAGRPVEPLRLDFSLAETFLTDAGGSRDRS